MPLTKIDGNRQIKDASITNTQISASAAIATGKLADGANFLKKDGTVAFSANQSLGGFKITNLAAPTAATDAVNKSYVDDIASGLDIKASVRAATTANGALATAFANAAVIDGVTLATGDRILIKNQTTGSENGIYVVNATGAPTRAADADSNAEVTAGLFTFVEQGTANADSGWVLATDGAIALGTTALVFSQFSSSASLDGGAGLLKTGNILDVVSANAGIVVNADNIALTVAAASALEVVAGGLRLVRSASAGQILVGNGTNDPTFTTLSGDVSAVTGAGAVTLGTAIQRTAGFVDRETPAGLVDGVNATYTLAGTPIVGSEHVYHNGLLMEPGTGNDYTISGATITWQTPVPLTGDKIRVSYRK